MRRPHEGRDTQGKGPVKMKVHQELLAITRSKKEAKTDLFLKAF